MSEAESLSDVYLSIDRDQLGCFVKDTFSSLPRADQRRWAEVYLRGLISTTGKKSIRNMVEVVLSDTSAAQSLQQFINQSPWDWQPVRSRIAEYVYDILRPTVWIIEHAAVSKRGEHSVGVEPRFVPHVGRTLNSQLGIGVFATSDQGSLPVNWRLHLSKRWLGNHLRRTRTRIPQSVMMRSETELALDMIDELVCDWSGPVLPVVAGAHPRDAVTLIGGLLCRSMRFLIQLDGDPGLLLDEKRLTVNTVSLPALRAGISAMFRSIHRDQTKRVPALVRARSDGSRELRPGMGSGHITSTVLGDTSVRLLRERLPGGRNGRAWLTNLPEASIHDLLATNALRRNSKAALCGLEEHYGLRDFEGRSFPGWHHHLTLVSAGALFAMRKGCRTSCD